ncbi:MAG: L-aspartate oxidase [Spirochaetia bacterium]|nr:L-aspartate oxidase [Spirochaetia bacterium]
MSKLKTDYLVIGSGIVGLSFAIKAADHGKVLIITKGKSDESATSYAQGGIAAAIGKKDFPKNHFEDTIKAGAGLCDEKAVDILVNEGVMRVQELIELGMKFTRNEKGELDLGREGGHTKNRIIHAHDYTGREIENFLLEMVRKNTNITIKENHMAVDLITEHHISKNKNKNKNEKVESCFGAYVLDDENADIYSIVADFTILATGGGGRMYPFSTNPSVSTADGIALAYRAGCRVRNMEFIQFHPTALFYKIDPVFLISEAVRGFGAKLRLQDGSLFMKNYHPAEELAPRDIVARAIDFELKKRGEDFVYLDITHKSDEELESNFPNIYNTLKKKFKINMSKEYIPVVPAAHYMCGGVIVDYDGCADLKFLYAAGETASTGVNGSNRLASNSLLEGLVFAHRAFVHSLKLKEENAEKYKKEFEEQIPEWDKGGAANLKEWVLIKHELQELQDIMWDYVGIVRSTPRLEKALRRIDSIYREIRDFYNRTIITRPLLELRNIALASQLVIRSALNRKESRGLHYNTDYEENTSPSRNDTILEPAIYKKSHFNNC